ncbi:MAG: rod shape-determining protein RodA [Candidatus Sungbacteria bacterium]|nr:rod shape-determining protein RodA [Candidatus Sungbacteria bacterium]
MKRPFLSDFDFSLLLVTILICAVGAFNLYSATQAATIGAQKFSSQLMWMGIGFFVMIVLTFIDYRILERIVYPIYAIIIIMLLMVLAVGSIEHGAQRWLNLSFITFQPAEILKFSFVVYLSSWLDSRRSGPKSMKTTFVPFIVMISVLSVFLVLQPDIGTLGIIIGTSILLYFLGGGKITQIFALICLGFIVLFFLIQAAPYRLERFKVFLDPDLDPGGSGYQIKQSFIAIGSGGILGKGFGKGIQKYNYIPEPIGDSVFAVFTEELGFAGAFVLVSLFLLFLWRGITIAERAPDFFGTLLAFGITIGILVQMVVNIGAISGLLPLTGVPLPFISYGGSALLINIAGIGVLLNISKHMA